MLKVPMRLKIKFFFLCVFFFFQSFGVFADETNPFAVSESQSNPGKFVGTNCANVKLVQGFSANLDFLRELVRSAREKNLNIENHWVKNRDGEYLDDHRVLIVPFSARDQMSQNNAQLVDMQIRMTAEANDNIKISESTNGAKSLRKVSYMMDCGVFGCILAAGSGLIFEQAVMAGAGIIAAGNSSDNMGIAIGAAVATQFLNLIRLGIVSVDRISRGRFSWLQLFSPEVVATTYIWGRIANQKKRNMIPSKEEISLQYDPIIQGFAKAEGPAAIVIFDAGRGNKSDLTENLKELFKKHGLELQ